MKRINFIVIAMLLATLSLGACSSGNSKTKSTNTDNNSKETANDISDSHGESDNVSFKDGTLKTNNFLLKIDKTQVGHDNYSGEDGIIIWYTLTNKSKKNIVPDNIFKYFKVQQSDGNSLFDLDFGFDGAQALYPTYDSNRQQIEDPKYSENLKKQDEMSKNGKSEAQLLPGKSVSTYQDFSLKNKEHDVTISLDPDKYSIKDIYTIKIKN